MRGTFCIVHNVQRKNTAATNQEKSDPHNESYFLSICSQVYCKVSEIIFILLIRCTCKRAVGICYSIWMAWTLSHRQLLWAAPHHEARHLRCAGLSPSPSSSRPWPSRPASPESYSADTAVCCLLSLLASAAHYSEPAFDCERAETHEDWWNDLNKGEKRNEHVSV